jgi:4-hydroxy-3-polyprenylbenzoate decarboxylase
MTDRIVVALTGASGAIYGIRALEMLRELGLETHLILSPAASVTISQETDWTVSRVLDLATVHYDRNDIAAPIASGSFATRGMIVIPCSVKTLSAIANSYADDLIVRAADVQLKEGRTLILVVRETPLHRGHLRLMDLAARAGAVIFPPVPAFYGRPQTLDDVVAGTVGRALLRLGIDNPGYTRWAGPG